MPDIQTVVFYTFRDDGIGDPAVYCGLGKPQIEELIQRETNGFPAEFQPKLTLLEELSSQAIVLSADGKHVTLAAHYPNETEARCIGVWDRQGQCVIPITWYQESDAQAQEAKAR